MSYLYRRINALTGMEEAVGTVSMKTYDEAYFDVISDSGATDFPLAGLATLTASSFVIVYRNGQELNEGGLLDFTKNVVDNKIVMNYVVPKGSAVKVRIYGETPEEAAFVVTNPSGITSISLDGYMTLSQKNTLAISRNGQELSEGGSNDFIRDTANNRILFNYVIPKKSIIKVRA